jgi:hypothetical protein
MYFDAVLDLDNGMKPIFNGTPEETKAWLRSTTFPEHSNIRVCLGKTLGFVTILEYLNADA